MALLVCAIGHAQARPTDAATTNGLVPSEAGGAGSQVPDRIDSRDRLTHIRVPTDPHAVDQLRKVGAAFVGGEPGFVDAYVRPKDVAGLRAQRIDVQVMAADYRTSMPLSKGGYHNSTTYIETLESLAEDHNNLVRLVDVGTSEQGRPIVGVIITSDVWARSGKPAVRILGGHHGDEWSSMEVALEVSRVLATSYATDTEVQALLTAHEIWVVPVVNPDGIEAFERENSNGVDLNRNYSFEWRSWSGGGPQPFSESETDAIRAISMRRSFAQSLTYHSGATCCAFSWGYTKELPFDRALLEYMCELYGATKDIPNFWVAGGAADWYQTNGDTNDWSYGVRGGLDYTIEVTKRKAPPEDDIPEFLDWHVEPTLALLNETRTFGAMGVVTDSTTGAPLEARVTMLSNAQPVYADPNSGVFHRLAFPGETTFLVEAPGYQSQNVTTTVSTGTATKLGVQLQPSAPAGVTLWRAEPSVVAVDAGEVQIRLHGEGLTGWASSVRLSRWDADDVDLSLEENGDVLQFTINPKDLAKRYTREGFYWITVVGSDRQVGLPRGLLVASAAGAGVRLEKADAENDAGAGGLHRVTVSGEDLPRGADLLLIGPSGRIVVPERIENESAHQYVGVFDRTALTDGMWDVVMYGSTRYIGLDNVLVARGGIFVGDNVTNLDSPDENDPSLSDDGSTTDPNSGSDAAHASGHVRFSARGKLGCSTTGLSGTTWWFLAFIARAALWARRRCRRATQP